MPFEKKKHVLIRFCFRKALKVITAIFDKRHNGVFVKKFDEKNKLKIIVAWFVVSYIILWLIGGACFSLASPNSDSCIAQSMLSGVRNVPVLGFIIPYNEWVSPMYWFAPIAGFVLGYFFIKWWNSYFESKEATSIIFLIVMILVLFGGFFINLNWYYGEYAANSSRSDVKVGLYFCFDNDPNVCQQTVNQLNQEYIAQAERDNASVVNQFILVRYWSELRESIFLTFILGVLAVWLPLFIFDYSEKEKKKEHKHKE
jgi:hypothetical protein